MLSRGQGSMQAAAVLSWGDAAQLEAVAMPGACRQENFSPRSDRALIPQAEMRACRACLLLCSQSFRQYFPTQMSNVARVPPPHHTRYGPGFSLRHQRQWHSPLGMGLGVKRDPQSVPSFTSIPGGHGRAKAGSLPCSLTHFWEGLRERAGLSLGIQPAPNTVRSASFGGSLLTPILFLGDSGRRSLGTPSQRDPSQGTAAIATRPGRQLGGVMHPSRR